MSDTLADALNDAYAALEAIGPPVRMDGDPEPDPPPARMIVLADVATTALPTYGLQPTTKRIQITCYAENKLAALVLEAAALVALRDAGFRFIQSRPAPDPDFIGQISEYRR